MELAAFKNSFGDQKVFYIEKEKHSLSDLSHDARKSFSANESYYIFFHIGDLKPVAAVYAILWQIL